MKWKLSKIWPWLVGIFFLLWLYIVFYSAHGYQEMLIPDGTEQLTASFSRISNIIPINEDVTQDALVEGHSVTMTIQFTDEADGTLLEARLTEARLHTNGYTSTDNIAAEGLPLDLVEGHTYTVQYQADSEGQEIRGLSIALYGESVSFRWLQVLLLFVIAIGVGCLVHITRNCKYAASAMLLLWCSLYVLYLLSVPLRPQIESVEQTAFARAYAVSNEMMGYEIEDAGGHVYVDDIGLRNTGYLSYDVPFYRFWSNVNADADSSSAATITYTDDGVRTLRTYVDAMAITAARQMGCSYPIVYLSGSLFAGILALIVLAIALVVCKSAAMRRRIMTVAVLPSVFSSVVFHGGLEGLFRPIDADYAWIGLDEAIRRVILYVTPYDSKALIITWVPIAILGTFLWNDLHKKTMPEQRERALFIGMVLVSVTTALLRLSI